MARPECDLLIVFILTSPDIQALVSCISDVLPGSFVESNQDVDLFSVWSDDRSLSLVESLSNLVCNAEVSSVECSDCLGS